MLGVEIPRLRSGFRLAAQTPRKRLNFVGDLTAGDPPVPIPNTEVKPRRADGTARESVWERRSSPALNKGQSWKHDWPFPFRRFLIHKTSFLPQARRRLRVIRSCTCQSQG